MEFHFENGSQSEVVDILSQYQNVDGGFAYGLEADCWNENSTPIQTWQATEILREIWFDDKNHPIIKGILHYLDSGKDFYNGLWHNVVKSNNDFPHADWWSADEDENEYGSDNPTACLAGFGIRFADENSRLYQSCIDVAKSCCKRFFENEQNDMHVISCYISLAKYLVESGKNDVVDIPFMHKTLRNCIKNAITQDKNEWNYGYVCKPSQFFNSKNSEFYDENREIAEYECDFIATTQLEDGSWNVAWAWSNYPEQWAISKNWSKSAIVLNNMKFLRGMGGL